MRHWPLILLFGLIFYVSNGEVLNENNGKEKDIVEDISLLNEIAEKAIDLVTKDEADLLRIEQDPDCEKVKLIAGSSSLNELNSKSLDIRLKSAKADVKKAYVSDQDEADQALYDSKAAYDTACSVFEQSIESIIMNQKDIEKKNDQVVVDNLLQNQNDSMKDILNNKINQIGSTKKKFIKSMQSSLQIAIKNVNNLLQASNNDNNNALDAIAQDKRAQYSAAAALRISTQFPDRLDMFKESQLATAKSLETASFAMDARLRRDGSALDLSNALVDVVKRTSIISSEFSSILEKSQEYFQTSVKYYQQFSSTSDVNSLSFIGKVADQLYALYSQDYQMVNDISSFDKAIVDYISQINSLSTYVKQDAKFIRNILSDAINELGISQDFFKLHPSCADCVDKINVLKVSVDNAKNNYLKIFKASAQVQTNAMTSISIDASRFCPVKQATFNALISSKSTLDEFRGSFVSLSNDLSDSDATNTQYQLLKKLSDQLISINAQTSVLNIAEDCPVQISSSSFIQERETKNSNELRYLK